MTVILSKRRRVGFCQFNEMRSVRAIRFAEICDHESGAKSRLIAACSLSKNDGDSVSSVGRIDALCDVPCFRPINRQFPACCKQSGNHEMRNVLAIMATLLVFAGASSAEA